MLFDKNGIFYMDETNPNYDFAVDIIDKNNKGFKTYDIKEAFVKGNLFPDLYDAYKSYRPGELKVSNEREKRLLEIQMIDFTLNDLNLYLDIYPNNREAYKMFKRLTEECKQKKEEYTSTYGPLEISNLTNVYEWSSGIWPWEEGEM